MATGYETNTQSTSPTPESLGESQLVMWGSNYDYRKELDMEDMQNYEEAAIFDNPDGSQTTYIHVGPLDQPPDGKPLANRGQDGDPRTFESSLLMDHASFEVATRLPLAKQAMDMLGYTVTRQEHGTEGTSPSTTHVNRVMEYLESQTGFAPRLKDFEGAIFPAGEMLDALANDEVLAGNDHKARSHDMFVHTPAWLLFPERTFKALAARGQELTRVQDSYDKDIQISEWYTAMRARKDFLGTLEGKIDIGLVRQAAEFADKPSVESSWLPLELYRLTYGGDMDSPEKIVLGTELATEMAARLKVVAEMPADHLSGTHA
jgi:hypothetical protein